MDDLVRWLADRLDEDERAACRACAHVSATWYVDEEFGGAVLGWAPGPSASEEVPRTSRRGIMIAPHGPGVAPHIARHDPDRVLRHIRSVRAVIGDLARALRKRDEHPPGTLAFQQWDNRAHGLHRALLRTAAVYADRPGYRAEWAL
ncbi:DUF6221 family protein [Streptomyces sp. LaPpAH-108]|uniref:DUF6221 family protein n=1 Tax=Streptomyces sp. LaPpAH-108 TaxID=1155714 RepID=UPI000371E320|nr:DUF6221 family protein [Streptomyces sp. LaPpAH-108]